MNNKGFTLVELLAMLVVLAILMAITIPNISGIIGNQRLNTIKNDATTMVETAKTKVAKSELIDKPTNRNCLVFSLDYLNDNGNIEVGPNGDEYDQFESFVIYTRSGNRYKYYVRLLEKSSDTEFYGIELTDSDLITEADSDSIKTTTEKYNLTEDSTTSENNLKGNSNITSICDNVKYYATTKYKCKKYQGVYYDKDGNITSSKEKCEQSGCGTCD